MTIAARLPALPVVPNHGRGAVKADVTCMAPVMRTKNLGTIPANWTQKHKGDSRPFDSWATVELPQPVLRPDGVAKMKATPIHLEAEPFKVGATACRYAKPAAIVALGATLGLAMLGAPLAVIGTVAVAGFAGIVTLGEKGLRRASHDRLAVQWKETPIVRSKLTGFEHKKSEHTYETLGAVLGGINGIPILGWLVGSIINTGEVDHKFMPKLADRVVGTYQKPVVFHYDDRKGPDWKPTTGLGRFWHHLTEG